MNKIVPLIAFILFCLIDFLGIYLEKQMMINFAKPMLMVTLFWYYYSNTKKLNKHFVFGLLFSFLGDVFLLGTGELYFILGLICFLIAHIFYIIMVLKIIKKLINSRLRWNSLNLVGKRRQNNRTILNRCLAFFTNADN